MKRNPIEHHQEFEELGYTIFEGVLTREEIDYALPIFDEVLTIDTRPPVVVRDSTPRRQLDVKYCEPRLSNYGVKPAVLEAVGMMLGGPFRLIQSPIPVVTFPGSVGGVPGQDWKCHVDWWRQVPSEFWDVYINGILHFTTVEPNGGGFTVVPGSHHLVRKNLDDPEMAERMFRQEFQDFPGLGSEKEIRAKAGDVLFWHPFLVHGPSDNQSTRVRKVLFIHYLPILDGEAEQRAREGIPGNIHQDHLAAMDEDSRRACGLA